MRSLIFPVLFLLMPLAEIAAFVAVGREVGVWTTLMLVLASGLAGIVLLRVQGFGVMARIQAAARGGADPGREMVHGAMIVVAAILLIIPGFISDIIGILLFIPPVRDLAWSLIRSRITIVTAAPGARPYPGPSAGGSPFGSGFENRQGGKIIDLDDDDFSHDDDRPGPGPTGPGRLR